MKRVLCLLILLMALTGATAQRSQDFASKFFSLCNADSTVTCVTISPKMMEQLGQKTDEHSELMTQAISKLKSARIVTAPAPYYAKAEELLKKNARRFQLQKEYRNDHSRGTFYTRKDKKGKTVELILLQENVAKQQLTVINVTGDIDEEFLCFLYNNKSFKN